MSGLSSPTRKGLEWRADEKKFFFGKTRSGQEMIVLEIITRQDTRDHCEGAIHTLKYRIVQYSKKEEYTE